MHDVHGHGGEELRPVRGTRRLHGSVGQCSELIPATAAMQCLRSFDLRHWETELGQKQKIAKAASASYFAEDPGLLVPRITYTEKCLYCRPRQSQEISNDHSQEVLIRTP